MTKTEFVISHRVHIERIFAEEMLDLPADVHITGATFEDGRLILDVISPEDLGALDVNALYGNIEEDEKQVHFGMFEPRE